MLSNIVLGTVLEQILGIAFGADVGAERFQILF